MACDENIASESIADFIIRYYSFPLTSSLIGESSCVDLVSNPYAILHQPLSEVLPLSLERFNYYSIPKIYTLLDSTSLESSGILRTFNQPALGNRGRGTLIGIVDTGIDYQNPLFRNRDGSSRVAGIWDQTIEGNGISGENPLEQLSYGTVYGEEQINAALRSSDPLSVVPSTDGIGHGTFLAEIAAGNEEPSQDFSGAAPEAMLVIVKLKQAKQYLRDYFFIPEDAVAFQENDIMLGIKYLFSVAHRYSMPLTVLVGLGTSQGSHDGTAPLASYLNYASTALGIVSVVAGGNETGFGHHYFGEIESGQPYEDVELRVAPGERGVSLELWAREPELFSVSFLSPGGEQSGRFPNSSESYAQLGFLLEPTVIYLDYRVAEGNSGSQLILMRFQTPSPGIWRIRVFNSVFIHGEYHMWLPVNPFISEGTYFLRSNPDTTITEPGNASIPITTSAYNHHNGGIYIHSSRGYTRLDNIKPDLAAPGVDLSLPGNQTMSGTSAAAAITAGAAASLLSWAVVDGNAPQLNTAVAKTILVRGAARSPNYSYPNREWGYGSLDLYNAFLRLRE